MSSVEIEIGLKIILASDRLQVKEQLDIIDCAKKKRLGKYDIFLHYFPNQCILLVAYDQLTFKTIDKRFIVAVWRKL